MNNLLLPRVRILVPRNWRTELVGRSARSRTITQWWILAELETLLRRKEHDFASLQASTSPEHEPNNRSLGISLLYLNLCTYLSN